MKTYKLKELAKVDISGVDKKSIEGEQPVRICNFVDVYHNWAITKDLHDGFMEATARPNEIERFKLNKGQVAFTKDSETRDDIGIPAYIADDFDDVILGYHNALVTPNDSRLDGKYLNVLMHTDYAKKYWACNASGSGQRYALSVEALESFPIPLPSLEEQKRIGDIFSAIDKKICLNKQINQNLEAMAKQLYDYWFVQFDFPNEGGKPYKSSGGEMEWNEKLKREIPKGWSSSLLSEIADIRNGATPSTAVEDNYGGNIIWITPKDLSDQQSKFVFYGQRNITQKGYDSCSTSMLPKGSVLLSSRAPIGLVAVAMAEVCTNQGFKNIVPNDMILTYFLYYYIKRNVQKIEQLGTGTTFKEVSKEDLRSFPILEIKDRTLLEKWNEKMVAFANQQFLLEKEILELTKQRDELLPLLMNGQVSVTQLNSDLSHD